MRPANITLTAPNGAKVRTARSRTYFVVAFGDHPRTGPYAQVTKRTDNPVTARRERDSGGQRKVIFDSTGTIVRP